MFSPQQRSPYYTKLRERITELGGMFNAHLHLDRSGTFEDKYFSEANLALDGSDHISLSKKHALISKIHAGPAYEKEDLESRVRATIDCMIELGTRGGDTMVDVTADRVKTHALEQLNNIRDDYADRFQLRTASYTPLGFRDDRPEQWDIFAEGVKKADFIGALPEADDRIDYPHNIGFEENCRRILELAKEQNKMVHFHTDQRNEPTECGTEQVIEAVKKYGAPPASKDEPKLWMVHMISPSTYAEERFADLAGNLADLNLGVICCPSAAVGMRQLRSLDSPTYNSIPRVLELLAAGVKVRIASDNIADICSPSTTADLVDEVFVLSAALRFYNIDILAHLAAGKDLSADQLEYVREHLDRNKEEIKKVVDKHHA